MQPQRLVKTTQRLQKVADNEDNDFVELNKNQLYRQGHCGGGENLDESKTTIDTLTKRVVQQQKKYRIIFY